MVKEGREDGRKMKKLKRGKEGKWGGEVEERRGEGERKETFVCTGRLLKCCRWRPICAYKSRSIDWQRSALAAVSDLSLERVRCGRFVGKGDMGKVTMVEHVRILRKRGGGKGVDPAINENKPSMVCGEGVKGGSCQVDRHHHGKQRRDTGNAANDGRLAHIRCGNVSKSEI
jgi:hypothetical protein